MPLSSIRLENLRDGIEDYEYLWILREAAGRLHEQGTSGHETLLAEAEKALAIDDRVVTDLTHFTQDPTQLRRARAAVARLIERVERALDVSAAGETGTAETPSAERGFVPLFPQDGVPKGWLVRRWNDIRLPADPKVVWTVKDGVLHGGEPRGTWLISEKEYGDFILTFDFKLGERGNSGCALRAPLYGDPAFDGLELQMADFRYNPRAKPSELTGGIYRAIAPRKQVYEPTAWNSYTVTLKGSHLRVVLNGELIHDLDMNRYDEPVKRHDGSDAPAVKDRPRRGHIGFQELSRDGENVRIRNARIKVLNERRSETR
jgi:hypothetical protein